MCCGWYCRELARYRPHAVRRGQHADLDRIRHNILKHRVDLLLDHLRADILDIDHARGIFRNNRHNHAHTEHAVRCHGLEISLYAGAARAVRTGDGKHLFHIISPSIFLIYGKKGTSFFRMSLTVRF